MSQGGCEAVRARWGLLLEPEGAWGLPTPRGAASAAAFTCRGLLPLWAPRAEVGALAEVLCYGGCLHPLWPAGCVVGVAR